MRELDRSDETVRKVVWNHGEAHGCLTTVPPELCELTELVRRSDDAVGGRGKCIKLGLDGSPGLDGIPIISTFGLEQLMDSSEGFEDMDLSGITVLMVGVEAGKTRRSSSENSSSEFSYS